MKPSILLSLLPRLSPRRSHEPGPDSAPHIRLHIENEMGIHEPQRRTFTQQCLAIGRDAANTLRLSNGLSLVSRRHAEIFWAAGTFWVRDFGSKNATYLNGRQLAAWRRYRLHHGDCLRVGDYRLGAMLDVAGSCAVAGGGL